MKCNRLRVGAMVGVAIASLLLGACAVPLPALTNPYTGYSGPGNPFSGSQIATTQVCSYGAPISVEVYFNSTHPNLYFSLGVGDDADNWTFRNGITESVSFTSSELPDSDCTTVPLSSELPSEPGYPAPSFSFTVSW